MSLSMRVLSAEKDGFTIVELLVGITLSAIFIGTIAMLQSNTAKLGQRGRDVAAANSYAENKVEELRSKGYLAVSTGTTDLSSELPSELQSPRSASLDVTTESDATKKIVLSITYNDQGNSKTYSYTTYMGEIGVGQ